MVWRVGEIIGIILLFISSNYNLVAQSITRKGEFWSRIFVMNRLSSKWTIGLDFQYRRQELDYHFMDVPLLVSYRTWVFYSLPQNFQLVSNPVMCIEHSRIRDDSVGVETNPTINFHELRMVWGGQHTLQLEKLDLRNRVLGEFRWMYFDKNDWLFRFRWRYQFLINVLLAQLSPHASFHIQVFDEVFFQPESITYPNTGITFVRFFDQNRVSLSLLTRIRVAELQLGFQYNYQLSGLRIFHKYQLLTGVLIRI